MGCLPIKVFSQVRRKALHESARRLTALSLMTSFWPSLVRRCPGSCRYIPGPRFLSDVPGGGTAERKP